MRDMHAELKKRLEEADRVLGPWRYSMVLRNELGRGKPGDRFHWMEIWLKERDSSESKGGDSV